MAPPDILLSAEDLADVEADVDEVDVDDPEVTGVHSSML
jgi:hypothetical protein